MLEVNIYFISILKYCVNKHYEVICLTDISRDGMGANRYRHVKNIQEICEKKSRG